jgi:hypothetical protein
MTTRKYSSRSQQTTLSASLTDSATTCTVVSGTGVLGGITVSAGQTFTVVIDPDTALEEIVDVTAVSTNTFTLTRGVEASGVGQAHSAGAVVRHMATGRDFREANTHIEASSAVHGIAGSVVGTTDTQTLTNKTLTSPTLTTPALGTPTAAVLTSATGLPLTSGVTGTLPVANGGTGVTTSTGTGSTVLSTSPTLVTPILGTPTSGTLTNTTGFPTANLAGLGTGVATFLATPTSANLAAAVTTETGSGALVFGTSPTIASPTITGTGAIAGTFTGNITGNVTGNVSGTSGSTTGNAATVTNGVYTTDTGTVTSTMILDGTIVNADLSTSAGVAYSKLSLNSSITSADIVNGTIVAADIADGTITAAKLTADPFARANHTGTQLAATVSDFDTQVRTSRLDQMAAPIASVALNAQKITGLGTPTLNTDASTKAYVDTAVANLVNSAPGTLDTLGEIATAISAGGTVFDAMVLKAGSTMTGALVLNANPTVNLGAATKQYVDAVAGSATAAAAAQAATELVYDNFDDRYLGAKSSAPTLDNDGNALITGAIYFNTVSNVMLAWSGSAWTSISSSAAIYRYRFTATGGETSKSGADDSSQTLAYLAGYEQVYLNGVLLVRGQDYTATNGTSITALSALVVNDVLEIITFTAFSVITDIPQSVVDAKGDLVVGTAADTVGRLGVGTNGQYLQADSTAGTGLKWATVTGYSAPTLGSTVINSGATVTTVAGLTLTAPTLTGTVTASGDITLSASGAFGSIVDFQTLTLMGAL